MTQHVTTTLGKARPFDPAPQPGLRFNNFRKICENGFGDGHNSYPHSMAWFKNQLYVGTTRDILSMNQVVLRKYYDKFAILPVEGPDDIDGLYKMDRRAQVWRYHPLEENWQMVRRAPRVKGSEGEEVDREIGYRAMTVFQGESDVGPALYLCAWGPSRSPGPQILRSEDGENFTVVSEYGIIGLPIANTRLLVPFKDRLFTSPTGARGGKNNVSGVPVVYESRDPAKGQWKVASLPGFGEPDNEGIFILSPFREQLYAGTFNCQGFQVWRTDAAGDPPYKWTKVISRGAWRGPCNQAACSMKVLNDALYVGTGIQNGGYDRQNNIGPAAPELIRIFPDDSWDLIVGSSRDTPDGKKKPLSALPPGFGNNFNGYFWAMEVHDGWLYLGTCNIFSISLSWISPDRIEDRARRICEQIGVDNIVRNQGGFDLWRSRDGENWLPVNQQGFGNPYNIGVRNMVSTQFGLFLGIANPFAPKIAVKENGQWTYKDNPSGGLEIWLGSR